VPIKFCTSDHNLLPFSRTFLKILSAHLQLDLRGSHYPSRFLLRLHARSLSLHACYISHLIIHPSETNMT